jgi:hypothetical protein
MTARRRRQTCGLVRSHPSPPVFWQVCRDRQERIAVVRTFEPRCLQNEKYRLAKTNGSPRDRIPRLL